MEVAAMSRSPADPDGELWESLAPHLDAALEQLSEPDRDVLLCRYFERQSAREVGQRLGISEEAAQKRVQRAVERLREILADRRVQVGATALAALLALRAVESAPETLPGSVAAAAASTASSGAGGAVTVRPAAWRARLYSVAVAALVLLGIAVFLFWPPPPAAPIVNVPPNPARSSSMRIQLSSVMVDDQEKARRFYTGVVGLVVKQDLPVAGGRWLTVVSPEEPDGMELTLEPIGIPAAQTYQQELLAAGIPWTALPVGDIRREHERMAKLGAVFKVEPTAVGPTTIAVLEDTCGNLIQIFQPPGPATPAGVRIRLASVLVQDQDRALAFYTGVLGFVKKRDLPAGGGRWLTVVSPGAPDGPELVLEPLGFPPARVFQAALREAGVPMTAFASADVEREHARLKELGVAFSMPPTVADQTTIAVLDDTCGNFIMLFQQ
jgi:catechol 2,3-dioxygenase-like lactoylglutathione lyase family enzyme